MQLVMEKNMSSFIFRVGVLGIIVIASVAFLPPLVRNSVNSSKDIYNLETQCWTPAQFMEPHVEFANAVCADQVRTNKSHPLPPTETEDELVGNDHYTVNDVITRKPKAECITFLFLALELFLLFVFHSLMPQKDANQDLDEKMMKELLAQGQEVKVRSLSHVQIGMCLMMAGCFAFLMVGPHFVLNQAVGKDTYHSGEVLCSFKIRQLGTIHTYTLQCFYSYEEPSGVNMQRALMMNSALCGVVVIMSFAQVVRSCFRKK